MSENSSELGRILGINPDDIVSVGIEEAGQANSIVLKRDSFIQGLLFKGGTVVRFHPNSWWVDSGILARNTTRQVGLNLFEFKADERILLFESGQVAQGHNILESTIVFPQITVGKGLVSFYDNGGLAFCNDVQSSIAIGNYMTKPGPVYFHKASGTESFSVRSCHFNQETRWGEYTAAHQFQGRDVAVVFHEGGSTDAPGPLAGFHPTHDTLIDGVMCRSNRTILLHKNGALKECELGLDTVIRNISLKADQTYLTFYESKALKRVLSKYEIVIDGVTYQPWRAVEFKENGDIISSAP